MLLPYRDVAYLLVEPPAPFEEEAGRHQLQGIPAQRVEQEEQEVSVLLEFSSVFSKQHKNSS